MDDVNISIGANDNTGDAVQDLAAALLRLSQATRRASSDTADLESKSKRADRAVDGLKQKAQGLERVAQGVGGRVGEMAGRVSALSSGLGALGPVAAAATVGIVGLGAAGLATFKTLQLGVAVASDMVAAFDEAHAAGLALGDDVGDRMDMLGESFDLVRVAGGLLVADIVTDWQPILTEFAVIGATGALEIRDAWNSLIGVAPTLRDNILAVARFAWAPYGEVVQHVIDSQLRLAAMFGIELPNSLRTLSNQAGQLEFVIADDLLPTLGEFAESQGFNTDRGRQLLEALRATGEQARTTATDFDELNRSAHGAADGVTALDVATKGPLQGDKKALDFDKRAALAAQALREQKAAMDDAAQSAVNYLPVLNSLGDVFGDFPDLFREGSKAAFAATKASAVGQAVINGALAVLNTLANVPAPFNIPAAVAVGGIAAAQAGIIAAEPPPTFDIGGVVTGGAPVPGGQAGQVGVVAQKGEVFLTRRDQADLMSAMGGGTTEVVLKVGNRTVERMLVENAKAGGTASRYRKSKGVHQRRYRG